MPKWTLTLACILPLIYLSNAYKILYISPLPSKSHGILGEALVKHLSTAGHEVTYIASSPPSKPIPRVSIIDISGNEGMIHSMMNIKSYMNNEISLSVVNILPILMNSTQVAMENPNLQKLLSDKTQEFDVVIVEWMFTEIFAGLSGVFNCPLIWFSTVEPHWKVLQLVDEMPNSAYNVDILSSNIPPLTFSQRILELCLQVFGKLLETLYITGAENELYENLFAPHIRNRGHTVQSYEAVTNNGSLVLSNSHVSMGTATRLPPNFIPIGGYHIDPAVKPLPQDLQKILDNARHGFIYFSMGSNLKSKHFPEEVRQKLLKVFGGLKQTVLWKFEEDLPNRPSNVHILEWAPQQSILAHKNCVLFITHGGLLSSTEAIHFGVPIIGIPVFADQYLNIERGVKKGFAKRVELSYSVAEHLETAIEEIITEPRYMKKAKELSKIYHDRPVPPGKELVHWVEHVVKTGGARHLRTPAFLMPWYQKLYLDLVLVSLIIIIAIKYVIRYICNSFRSKKSITNKKKQN